jgi:hypothetical protein
MSQPKMRGYMYQIVEMFPIEEGHGIRELHSYDNLADAEKVMEALESVNVNFTCVGKRARARTYCCTAGATRCVGRNTQA